MTHLNRIWQSGHAAILFVVLCLVMSQSLQASQLAYEGFDYGTAGISGQNGGVGWGGAWAVSGVETDGTSLATPAGYNLATTGGKVHVAAASGKNLGDRDLGFSIDMNPVAQQTYYVSYLFMREDATNNPSDEWFNNYFQGGGDILFQTGDTETLRVAMPGGSNSTAASFINLNTTYLLVGRLVANPSGTADVMSATVYEVGVDSVGLEPISWDAEATSDIGGVFGHYRILWDHVNTGTVNLDEIRIGTTWADVTGVVPEPASMSLLLFAGAMISRRRQRVMY